ncbi:peptidyl-prolyl isomerase cwc27 [Zalerion maritima]|uniref:peptidylprolyl isomerase n=1 Tax=Zalerion maritima TaxID=339359 RepID=A0AAD5RPA1_9PEZI|nr:peptidyl-prolyl isomerase cwc27 [Zalerion maritima]
MSSHYNLEPQPTASAVIHTTQGELFVEIFAKQTPLTCRNFLQLSLDGYYDNTIFHRLVPGFILQGGDPTGTGNGGESIYDGGAFSGDLDPWPMDQRRGKNAGPTGIGIKDEFHSRLRFNRRGLLGMANESSPDTNGSQFFFTLDKAEELTQKNTLFGRITGDTIYNLAKMGEAEVQEGTDRPVYPIKITHIEILVNPFQDMHKRERVARIEQKKKPSAGEKKKKKKPGKKLLSFGDDEGEDEDLPVLKKPKFDTRIVMDVDEDDAKPQKKAKTKTKKPIPAAESSVEPGDAQDPPPEPVSCGQPRARKSTGVVDEEPAQYPEPKPLKKKSLLEQANAEIAALKASMRRDRPSGKPRDDETSRQNHGISEELVPENAIRGRKRKHGANLSEMRAMSDLSAWVSKLEKAPTEKKAEPLAPVADNDGDAVPTGASGAVVAEEADLCDLHFIANCMSCRSWDKEDKDDSDDEGWMSNALKAAPDLLGKDLSFRTKAEDGLIVIDPREKAKNLRDEKRASREARSGGTTGREWDQARNAKLARQSALAGRGAK